MKKILIVEDDLNLCRLLELSLKEHYYQVETVNTGKAAKRNLKQDIFDVVVLDFHLPDTRAIDLIPGIKEKFSEMIIIVMSAYGSISIAKECVEKGATSFVLKPFNLDQIHYIIQRVDIEKKLREEEVKRYDRLVSENCCYGMVGRSVKIREVYETIRTVSGIDVPIVILGETGVGKELVAWAIHENSQRRRKEMVVINCAALPEALLESELFGHLKGAFTGAYADKKGLVEAADGSTLFLDEIGDLSPGTQIKILRFIQDHQFRPVGSVENLKSDVRIIASTSRDLNERVAQGLFRKDLYYRLNVVAIHVPPLRERREDIPILAHYFLRQCNSKHDKAVQEISPEAMNILVGNDWEGNVRELEHASERGVTFCDGSAILPRHLLPHFYPDKNESLPLDAFIFPSTSLHESMEYAEKSLILSTLETTGWNKKESSAQLRINPATLWKKMKRYNIPLQNK
jgi:two-component system, NtrC family, response regulator AtoC